MMTPVIDMGHGYMIAGQYQTAGKRSPKWHKGILYEGVSNKHFGQRIMECLIEKNIPFYINNPEPEDIPLWQRVRRYDEVFKKNPSTYLFSIHSNAGGGTGIEGFTTKGETISDRIATQFLCDLQEDFPGLTHRHDNFDGDPDKEVDYYILRNSKGPAVLMEYLFMDNKDDYELLFDPVFREKLVNSTVRTMIKLYQG